MCVVAWQDVHGGEQSCGDLFEVELKRGARWFSGKAQDWWSQVRILLAQLCFGTLAIRFIPLCQCLSEETQKAVGPFYLVSMPEDLKDPTQGLNV